MDKIYFEEQANPEYLYHDKVGRGRDDEREVRMFLVKKRNWTMLVLVFQLGADMVAMGLAPVRGSQFVLIVMNLGFLACAAIAMFGAVKIIDFCLLIHWSLNLFLIVAMLIIGFYDLYVDGSWVRLATFTPLLIDIVAMVFVFILWRTVNKVTAMIETENMDLEERRVAAEQLEQQRRHEEFEESKNERAQQRKESKKKRKPKKAEPESDSASDSKECVVCLEKEKDTMLSPCNHVCCCKSCAKELLKKNMKCPVCRGAVEKIERVYI